MPFTKHSQIEHGKQTVKRSTNANYNWMGLNLLNIRIKMANSSSRRTSQRCQLSTLSSDIKYFGSTQHLPHFHKWLRNIKWIFSKLWPLFDDDSRTWPLNSHFNAADSSKMTQSLFCYGFVHEFCIWDVVHEKNLVFILPGLPISTFLADNE